jgi:hypothetical protein
LVLKFRVLALQFSPIRICGQGFKYTANSKAKVTNAQHVRRDSIELIDLAAPCRVAAVLGGTMPDNCVHNFIQSLANIFT